MPNNTDTSMDPELAQRRERTYELRVLQGQPYSETVRTVAREFDCSEAAVKKDLARMVERENGKPGWIDDLAGSQVARKDGITRLLELRKTRQQLQRTFREAREDPDTDPLEVAEIAERLADMIDLDIALSQSLGLTDREPAQLEVDHQFEVHSDVVEVEPADVDHDLDGGPESVAVEAVDDVENVTATDAGEDEEVSE